MANAAGPRVVAEFIVPKAGLECASVRVRLANGEYLETPIHSIEIEPVFSRRDAVSTVGFMKVDVRNGSKPVSELGRFALTISGGSGALRAQNLSAAVSPKCVDDPDPEPPAPEDDLDE